MTMHQILCQEFNQENSHHFNENTDQYDLQTNVSAWWRNLYQGNLSEIMIFLNMFEKVQMSFPQDWGLQTGCFLLSTPAEETQDCMNARCELYSIKTSKGCSQNRENRASRKLLAPGSTCRRSC